ncbi:hypothetical protein ABZV87_06175 [Streptomyces tendae]|uniref:SCO2400 family protein n=1 Tax=Streptomyces tendae TaxID=1932 RepID=UPI0033AE7F4A
MDYCSSCRRHLNGALVCPGCGAYAPDIDPHVGGNTGDMGDTGDTAGSGDPASAGPSAAWPSPVIDPALAPISAPGVPADIGATDGPPAQQTGRAARRRQLARWKKNKRRAVVASAVAIVGGGLTIASVDRHSDHRAQATTAPANRTPSVSPEQTPGHGASTSAAPTAPERAQGPTPVSGPSQPQPRPSTDSAEPQQPVESRHRSTATASPQSNDTPPSGTIESPTTARPRPHTSAPASGDTPPEGTDPTTRQPPDTTAPGDGTDEDPPGTPPAADPSSPQLCLLVVCLG